MCQAHHSCTPGGHQISAAWIQWACQSRQAVLRKRHCRVCPGSVSDLARVCSPLSQLLRGASPPGMSAGLCPVLSACHRAPGCHQSACTAYMYARSCAMHPLLLVEQAAKAGGSPSTLLVSLQTRPMLEAVAHSR